MFITHNQQSISMYYHITIIAYEPTVPYSLISLLVLCVIVSYLSMIYMPSLLLAVLFPLLNSYVLTSITQEYLYSSLMFFIFLEVMLFLAYFWWYFHNLSYSGLYSSSNISPLLLVSSQYYLVAGLLLSLLSTYISGLCIVLFLILSFSEYSNVLDCVYLNDNAFVSIQLTIVALHLLHLLVGLLFILSEVSYPHYYHFIEVIWLLIGYSIYFSHNTQSKQVHRLSILLTGLSHLRNYQVSLNLNYLYNFGFLLGVSIFIQTVSGIFLTLIYYSTLELYSNVYVMTFDYYYGYLYRYVHIVFASVINALLLIHMFKSLLYSNFYTQVYTHYSGFILYVLIVVISYLGYILTYGQLSYWGATVIINLLPVQLATLILGSYAISPITISRYLIFHMLLSFILYFFIILHIFYLHSMSSQSPVPVSVKKSTATQTNITFLYFIYKDITSTLSLLTLSLSIALFTLLTLSHPINMMPINSLVTPAHIVPEWYFLYLYSILKIVPSKLGGILGIVICLLTILVVTTSSYSTQVNAVTLIPSSRHTDFALTVLLVYLYLSYIGVQLPIAPYISSCRTIVIVFIAYLFITSSSTPKGLVETKQAGSTPSSSKLFSTLTIQHFNSIKCPKCSSVEKQYNYRRYLKGQKTSIDKLNHQLTQLIEAHDTLKNEAQPTSLTAVNVLESLGKAKDILLVYAKLLRHKAERESQTRAYLKSVMTKKHESHKALLPSKTTQRTHKAQKALLPILSRQAESLEAFIAKIKVASKDLSELSNDITKSLDSKVSTSELVKLSKSTHKSHSNSIDQIDKAYRTYLKSIDKHLASAVKELIKSVKAIQSSVSTPTGSKDEQKYINILSSTNHKRIGLYYLLTSTYIAIMGIVLSIIMRIELSSPSSVLIHSTNVSFYNYSLSNHGLLMLLFIVMPIVFGSFGNYLLVLTLGLIDIVFPRINNLGYQILVLSYIIIQYSILTEYITGAGWTLYPPLSTITSTYIISSMYLALTISGVSSLLTSINYLLLLPYLLSITDLLLISFTITSIMVLYSIPVLAGAFLLATSDILLTTSYFSNYSDPVLYQHLFWFFGHPEVYILILPSFGLINYQLSSLTSNYIFGTVSMILALVSILLFGTIVWSHHMFTVNLESDTNLYFTILTLIIAIPTGTKLYNWLYLANSSSQLISTSSLSTLVLAYIFLIIVIQGGVTGVVLGNNILDLQLHDTYYVVSHFHYILSVATVISIVLTLYSLAPSFNSLRIVPLLSSVLTPYLVLTVSILLNTIFLPMYYLGFNTMPRRIPEYADYLQVWNSVSSCSVIAFYLALATLLLL